MKKIILIAITLVCVNGLDLDDMFALGGRGGDGFG